MSKQTAVEWLVEEIHKNGEEIHKNGNWIPIHMIEQAKQMEKEQIVEAFENYLNYYDERGEVYYNETYGGQDEQGNR